MTMSDPAPEAVPTETGTTWRELAVARSVDPARVRAERRVQRFLDAALEVISGESGKDFTVQEVVKKSGQSLRSFYQYFGGKHELLLALFEESVSTTAQRVRASVTEESDPVERLHRFTVEYYRLCRLTSKDSKVRQAAVIGLAEFAQQLLTAHPKEAARAFTPITALLVELLDEAAAEGAIRAGLDHRRVAGTVLQATMFNSFAVTIGGLHPAGDTSVEAEALWALLLNGMAPDGAARPVPAADRSSTPKAPAKKTPAKQAPAKQAPAKQSVAKKAPAAKQAAAKKAPAKQTVARKPTARKTTAKKTAAKKATAERAPGRSAR